MGKHERTEDVVLGVGLDIFVDFKSARSHGISGMGAISYFTQ